MEFSQLASLISGGGVVAFAGLVYVQLVAFRKELEKHRGELEQHRKDESETRTKLTEVIGVLNQIVSSNRDRAIVDQLRDEISGVHQSIGSEDPTPVESRPTIGGAYSKVKRAKSEPGGAKP
jgi:hypothetical protein